MAKVLIVEDDLEISRFVGTMLVSNGLVPFSATSAERAWEQLRAEPDIKLMLLDHNLGNDGISGLSLLAAIRSAPQFRELPVLVCTGETKPEIVSGFLAHRIAGLVKKPFHPQRLMTDIHRVLVEAEGRDRTRYQQNPPRLIREPGD